MMDDSLYRINLGSMSVKKVVEGLSTGSYCASESNRYFAWVDSANQYSSNTIKVMDLKNGKTFEIKRATTSICVPLGFIGEDFILSDRRMLLMWSLMQPETQHFR